jgi:hypothetical protein
VRTNTKAACLTALLLLTAGCSGGHGSTATKAPVVRADVVAGRAVTVSAPGRHLTVTAAPDVLAPGTLTVAPAESGVVHDAVVVTGTGDVPVIGELQLHFTTPAEGTVAYLDAEHHRWVAMPTVRSGADLVGTASHLTEFGWFDGIRQFVAEKVGTRAAPPKCSGKPPDWVHDIITVDGTDAQLLVCAETAGTNVDVTVVNNRAYPVVLDLSAPVASHVDLSWPESTRDFLDRLAAATERTPTGVTLPALGTAHLTLPRPNVSTVVTGTVRTGMPSALLTIVINVVLDLGLAELDPVVAGKPLGLSTIDCLAGTVAGIPDVTSTDVGVLTGAVQKFSSCALQIIEAQRNALILGNSGNGRVTIKAGRATLFNRLSQARDVFKAYAVGKAAATFAAQAADIGLDLRPDIRDGVDLTLDLRGPDPILLTATSIAGVGVGGSAAQAEQNLRQRLGAPSGTTEVPGCDLGDPPTDSRHHTTWGGLTLITGSSGSSKGKVIGWAVRPGSLPAYVRLPYNVTTATTVRDALTKIPAATGDWNDVFGMYTISSPHASTMTWAGDKADGSGPITFITDAWEPCD